MKYFKKIIGERIYLSPINVEDVEQYTIWLNDLKTTISLGFADTVMSLSKEKEELEKLVKRGNNFAIIDEQTDLLIGNCGLFSIDQINRHATVGLFIGDAANRGKGFGTEALKLLLDFGFNILNLHNIMLNVFDFNQAGIKCYQKVGFKEIGRRREVKIVGGKKYDEVFMDILSSEFESPYVKKIMEQ